MYNCLIAIEEMRMLNICLRILSANMENVI